MTERPVYWLADYLTPDDVLYHAIHRVIVHKRTAYQEMWIVDCGTYGKGLILDGLWQSSTGDDFLYHEALVQPACVHHGGPQRALVLGGGEGATVRELLKWKTIERVVMVDLDREVVEACKEHLPEMHQGAFDDPRVELVFQDAMDYLDSSSEKWDVIISDLTDPTESGPSFQLFTREYFEKARQVLRSGGCFLLQAGPVAPASMTMHVRLVSTLKAVFRYAHSYHIYVPVLGLPWGFILASDAPINTRPDPEQVDRLLAEKTNGQFKMFDGIALLGLMQSPKYVRDAIARETTVYTLEHPPVFSTQEGSE